MKAYTWCKTSYMADGSRRTFKDGYIGALTCRTSWANAVLSKMGSVNLADLSGLGTEVSGGLDSGGFGDGGAGMGNSNAYPVHDEYKTFTGQGGNIFENSKDNAFQMASATSKQTMFSSKDKFASSHTRIYSTNDSCIVLDELKIPYNSNDPAIEYANQGITKEDVAKNLQIHPPVKKIHLQVKQIRKLIVQINLIQIKIQRNLNNYVNDKWY